MQKIRDRGALFNSNIMEQSSDEIIWKEILPKDKIKALIFYSGCT